MVFVHARNATVRSANVLKDMALNEGSIEVFSVERLKDFGIAHKQAGVIIFQIISIFTLL